MCIVTFIASPVGRISSMRLACLEQLNFSSIHSFVSSAGVCWRQTLSTIDCGVPFDSIRCDFAVNYFQLITIFRLLRTLCALHEQHIKSEEREEKRTLLINSFSVRWNIAVIYRLHFIWIECFAVFVFAVFRSLEKFGCIQSANSFVLRWKFACKATRNVLIEILSSLEIYTRRRRHLHCRLFCRCGRMTLRAKEILALAGKPPYLVVDMIHFVICWRKTVILRIPRREKRNEARRAERSYANECKRLNDWQRFIRGIGISHHPHRMNFVSFGALFRVTK